MTIIGGIDYTAELQKIREDYVAATPRQRLSVIRQRLRDHHFGPNRLVTSVSAVEALARSLVMNQRGKTRKDLLADYPKFRNRKPETLVLEFLKDKGIPDPKAYFGEENWLLFGYAVSFRNLVAHECTYLGLAKFTALIQACNVVLSKLAKLGRVRETRA